jgi:TIR domain-containing protein
VEHRDYTYWAFVSYSHHDRRIAKWLVDALSKERVPGRFRDLVAGRPRYFAPLFRDEMEAGAASSLSDAARSALEASKNLIVICSPFAVASNYVSDEIRYFISLGRTDRILCLIASGIPNAEERGQPMLECFPEPLRFRVSPDGTQTEVAIPLSETPLAAALSEETPADKRHAVQQIVLGLLGISQSAYDNLSARRRLIGLGINVTLTALIALAGYLAYDFAWAKHSRYYRSYVRQGGDIRGVDPIDAETASHLSQAYRFTRRGRAILNIAYLLDPSTTMEAINGSGYCTREGFKSVTHNNLAGNCSVVRACAIRVTHDEQGRVIAEELHDQFDHVIETLSYDDPGSDVAHFSENKYTCTRGQNGIAFAHFTRDPKTGYDVAVSFESTTKGPVSNDNDIHGYRFSYDAAGHTIQTINIGRDGKAMSGQNVAVILSDFGPKGEEIRTRFRTADGKPFSGFTEIRRKFDRWGNATEFDTFDAQGRPVALSKTATVQQQETFDEHGNMNSETLIGPDKAKIQDVNGFVTERWLGFDNQGNAARAELFGAHGEFLYRTDYRYDRFGDLDGEWYFDSKGQPMLVDGEAGRKVDFDVAGNDVQFTYFGLDHRPRRTGVAFQKNTFDREGRKTSITYLDWQHRLVAGSDGIAIFREVFDGDGDRIETLLYGADGKLTVPKDWGYARSQTRTLQTSELRYFDAEGNLIDVGACKCARVIRGVDGNGQGFTHYLKASGEEVPKPSDKGN